MLALIGLIEQAPLCLFTGRRSISQMPSIKPQTASLIDDRVITLRLPVASIYGIFSTLPADHPSAGAFANSLREAARDTQGVAMHRFLLKLVEERATGETGLASRLSGYMATFRRILQVDENDGTNLKTANAFGLLYAAGRLAQEYGVLPQAWECGPAIKWVYQNCLVSPERYRPLLIKLEEIAAGLGVVVLRTGVPIAPKEAANVDVFVQTTPIYREIMIRPRAIDKVLPGLGSADMQREAATCTVREPGHKTVKRILDYGGFSVRMYVFRFPLATADTE